MKNVLSINGPTKPTHIELSAGPGAVEPACHRVSQLFRRSPVIATVALLTACSVQTPYPGDWEKAGTAASAPCQPLHGTFSNFGDWAVGNDMDERLLAGLFFPLRANERLDRHAERTAVTHVAFEARDENTVHSSAWVGDELLFERTLTGQDLACGEGLLVFRDAGWVVEGSMALAARVSSRYVISIATDGALVFEQREAGLGFALGVVPITGKARSWVRFSPFVAPGQWSAESPRGVRAIATPAYQLLLPVDAKKWSAYDQAVECVNQAKMQPSNPLSTAELGRLGGRSTQAFLNGRRDGTLVPSGKSHKTMGWIPATHDLRVEKLHWKPPVIADRYVLCLLDQGYRWN